MAKAVTTKKSVSKKTTSRTSKEVSTKVAFEKAANNTRRATGSGAKPFWYLNHIGDLAAVTKEPENLALGITKIDIFEPTEKQEAIGVLCKVRVHTLAATVDNISIFESDFAEGDIYMQMGGGRNIGTDQEAKWVRDCKLTAQGKAQVLSYVHTLLVPNE